MLIEAFSHAIQLAFKPLVTRGQGPETNECPHHLDARLDGPRRVQDTGEHNCTMLGENAWEKLHILTPLQGRILRP